MGKETSAALKAGAVAGFLFPILNLLLLAVLGLLQPFVSYLSAVTANNGLALRPDFMILVTVLGSLLVGLLLACLGAVLGLVFVRIMGNLPFRSTYPNALLFGLLLFVVYSLRYVLSWHNVDLSFSLLFMLDASIFAYLFDHWAKK